MRSQQRILRGVSLTEIMVVMAILGVLAAVIIVRFSQAPADALENACYVNQGEIEVQAQRWIRRHGDSPAADLSDIGGDTGYFPDGQLPPCPTGGTYTFDSVTGEVTCTHHP